MRILILTPMGGLANRIRAIEAAYTYAAKHASRLQIVWEQNNILNASFYECFQPIEGVEVVNLDYSGYGLLSKIKRKLIRLLYTPLLGLNSGKKIKDDIVRSNLDENVKPTAGNIFFDALARSHAKIHIETCYEFYSNASSGLVKLNDSISEQGERIIRNFTRLIGVHIRRTDNLLATQNSPLDLYLTKMNNELSENPEVHFYISTDSDEVLEKLKAKFHNKIISGAIERRRDTTTGIRSALVDLYCLSRCGKIMGSFYSSFSEQASKMGNVPLEIISKN